MIIKPIPIILDSSTWIYLISSLSSPEKGIAVEFIEKLNENGFIPLLTWHNISELINIDSNDVARERISQFTYFENIYLLNYSNQQIPGSILDLRSFEFEIIHLNSIALNIDNRCNLFEKLYLSSGKNIYDIYYHYVDTFMSAVKKQFNQDILISSFNPHLLSNMMSKKLKTIKNIPFPTQQNKEFITAYKDHVENTIKTKGDKRLEGYEKCVSEDFSKIVTAIRGCFSNINSPVDILPAMYGLSNVELDENLTLQEAIFKLQYLKSNEIISKNTKIAVNDLNLINQDSILSWKIEKLLTAEINMRIAIDVNDRSHASNLTDKYLASFSPYFDVIVDKRIFDLLNRITRRDNQIKIKYHKLNTISNYKSLFEKIRNGA